MAEPFIGEIIMFGGNFAPRSWAFCDGQLLPISQNTALFSILGTIYGGDGRTTFGLPDMRGRAPLGARNGPGLTTRGEGERGGLEYNVLNTTQIPSHNHTFAMQGVAADADSSDPSGRYPAQSNEDVYASSGSITPMGGGVTGNTGGGQQVNNMQPWLCVNFIICLQGIFPSRS